MNNKMVQEFCIGCGLCESAKGIEMQTDKLGYLKIVNKKLDKNNLSFISNVCPMSIKSLKALDRNEVWGTNIQMYLGNSRDLKVRNIGSSGGVLTSLAIYLLENKLVDGIIHTGMSKDSVIETTTYCSKSVDEIINNAGSRYTISSPLKDIFNLIEKEKKYLFVGKPCDVTALKNYFKYDNTYEINIPYTFSFFCAGIPSKQANLNLLSKFDLGEKECSNLTYRGNGWPGDVTITSNRGNEYKLSYENAWGKILGRDIHKFCRFCMDGIGERADIACGDAWYLDEDKQPDFSNKDGRNIIITRSVIGEKILKEAELLDYVKIELFSELNELHAMQIYQFDRKTTMSAKLLAMRLLLKQCPPTYNRLTYSFAKKAVFNRKFKIFKGTIKRIITNKI